MKAAVARTKTMARIAMVAAKAGEETDKERRVRNGMAFDEV